MASLRERTVERALEPRYEKSAEQVDQILRAAVELIRDTETLDLRVTDVIARAGVSNRAFYRHFSGKTELLITLLEDGNRQYMEHVEAHMARAASPLAAVETWMRHMLARAQEPHHPADTRPFLLNGLRFAYEFPSEALAADEVLRAPLRRALAAARAAGELPPGDDERDLDHLVQLTFGHMSWSLLQRTPIAPAAADHIVAFALAGLRSERP